MAKIVVSCPDCSTKYSVDEAHVGKRARCKRCNATFILSRTGASPPSEAETRQSEPGGLAESCAPTTDEPAAVVKGTQLPQPRETDTAANVREEQILSWIEEGKPQQPEEATTKLTPASAEQQHVEPDSVASARGPVPAQNTPAEWDVMRTWVMRETAKDRLRDLEFKSKLGMVSDWRLAGAREELRQCSEAHQAAAAAARTEKPKQTRDSRKKRCAVLFVLGGGFQPGFEVAELCMRYMQSNPDIDFSYDSTDAGSIEPWSKETEVGMRVGAYIMAWFRRQGRKCNPRQILYQVYCDPSGKRYVVAAYLRQ